MGLRINTNVPSLMAQRAMSNTQRRLNGNFRKLSSGERITRAADDAAGLAISENLKSQIRSIRQASRNANDAVSMIQTAEGGLSEISNILIRLRELAMQSASDTIGDRERKFTDIEFQKLKDEVDRISRSAEFNDIYLLNGTGGVLEFQVGVRNDPILDRLQYNTVLFDATTESLGISSHSAAFKEGAQISLKVLDDALSKVNGMRARLGALQNRLQSVVNNLGVNDESLSAANSRIRDIDVASESADLARNNIIMQTGVSVLTQANNMPKIGLNLLN